MDNQELVNTLASQGGFAVAAGLMFWLLRSQLEVIRDNTRALTELQKVVERLLERGR